MKRFSLLLTVLIAMTIAATPGFCKAKVKPVPPMHIKEDTIASVSANSIVVTHVKELRLPDRSLSETKSTKEYTIVPLTTVQVNGMSAKVDALKVGMAVDVSADGSADASAKRVARSITARDAKKS